jgi:hypothetical protein
MIPDDPVVFSRDFLALLQRITRLGFFGMRASVLRFAGAGKEEKPLV